MATTKGTTKKATIVTATADPAPAPAPKATKYAASDNSIDARMARLLEDHQRMGARPK